MLLDPGYKAPVPRKNQPEVKYSQLSYCNNGAQSVMSRLKVSVQPVSLLHKVDVCKKSNKKLTCC